MSLTNEAIVVPRGTPVYYAINWWSKPYLSTVITRYRENKNAIYDGVLFTNEVNFLSELSTEARVYGEYGYFLGSAKKTFYVHEFFVGNLAFFPYNARNSHNLSYVWVSGKYMKFTFLHAGSYVRCPVI